MNKSKTLIAIIAMAILATTVAIVSCKKEKAKTVNEINRIEAQALLDRIEAFNTLRNVVYSGTKESGNMTVEELRQILDLVSNYEHSQHMTYCVDKIIDTLHIPMPEIDVEGNVRNTDVVATYDAFETALEKRILGVTDNRTVPSYFSIVMPEIGTKDNGDILIVFTRGQEGVDLSPIDTSNINDNFCLYWGYGLGSCSGTNLPFLDATDFLSQLFEFHVTPPAPGFQLVLMDVEYVTYTAYDYPYNNEGWVYWEPASTPTCADHWLYVVFGEYEDDEPCICWDEMLCYYYAVNQYVVSSTGTLHNSIINHSPYLECSFNWNHLYPSSKRSVRNHTLCVKYANCMWVDPFNPK